jgi:quercetin dioxygenase-like cupin family protein
MTEFKLKQDSTLPLHKHPYEQTGYLVSGKMLLQIGSKKYECSAGDSWCIPFNVEHSAFITEDSIAIEIFSPVRKDYLPKGSI